jgi:peptide/nickel transport system permease protein
MAVTPRMRRSDLVDELGPVLPGGDAETPAGGLWRLGLSVFLENRLAVVGLGIVAAAVLFCFLGPHLYHTVQTVPNTNPPDLSPSGAHPLGTDDQGFDVLGRLMVGGQADLEVGLAAAAFATVIGMVWGSIAGYLGGAVDAVMMRVVDAIIAIPALFVLLILASAFKGGVSVPMLIVVLAMVAWLGPSRLVRGETLSLRVREYVEAVRGMGGGTGRIIGRHIIPNAIGTIIVNATFQVADAILYLAALSYLGLGLQFPQTDWGSMLSSGTNSLEAGYWWLVYPAGAAIVLVVVAFNFVGDALRDSFEARLQRR